MKTLIFNGSPRKEGGKVNQDAGETMKNSYESCAEYSMRFMLRRDLTILEKIEKTKISS